MSSAPLRHTPPLNGFFAAAVTPVGVNGEPDLEGLRRVIDFVMARGLDGIVSGGGTGEYPHFTVEQRKALTETAARSLEGRGLLITAVSTSSIHSTLDLARHAEQCGSACLLIAMPYFFRYQQQDLIEFTRTVCEAVSTPCLLYNLPSFTNGITVETALKLIEEVPNLRGMKDSSGEITNLRALAGRDSGTRAYSLLVGDDDLLLQALQAGWNGAISGIACCAPEAILAVAGAFRSGDVRAAEARQAELDQLIEQIVQLPIPWGVRVALAARGIPTGPLHLPLSPERRQQVATLTSYIQEWEAKFGATAETRP